MRRRKKEYMSVAEANAYKTRAEGKALLVSAWMPLLVLVTLAIILVACNCFGLDLAHLELLGEFVIASLGNTTKQ